MDNHLRSCFVTVGATTGFRALLEEVLSDQFLSTLTAQGYGYLTVQAGPDYQWFKTCTNALQNSHGLQIDSFERSHNMQHEFLRCRGQKDKQLAGCVISHAGSGTILEVGRYSVPLVVVPNPDLLNNHQAELAEEVERQDWAVYGRLGKLHEAMRRNQERIIKGRHDRLPPHEEEEWPCLGDSRIKVFDWVALTAFPEELRQQEHLHMLAEMDKVNQSSAGSVNESLDQAALRLD